MTASPDNKSRRLTMNKFVFCVETDKGDIFFGQVRSPDGVKAREDVEEWVSAAYKCGIKKLEMYGESPWGAFRATPFKTG
jgi:hypothetical protein